MSNLIKHIEKCLKLTDEYKCKVTPKIINMDGMSGIKTRHFYK
jgi:hypothetical protein